MYVLLIHPFHLIDGLTGEGVNTQINHFTFYIILLSVFGEEISQEGPLYAVSNRCTRLSYLAWKLQA